jgi:lipopolysaccharide transport system ATP-binding protein
MDDYAVRAVGLGKMYRIGGTRQRYGTIRDAITAAALRPIERLRNPGAATHVSDDLWALKDVDFEVVHGDAVGIIGRNGAGKTTLLKILSHITEPTEGKVEINGRVGSLLEVGTGFHPELTGRENIQLNGAILGMTRAEIRSKFDEIVEFSEIGRFLDTPVKRYSSGMYVRLAFAVAAHLEPEILIVDEVLAVGDVAFQKKCLGKMEDVTGRGRTVLFVSHNMTAVRSLCRTAVQIEAGKVVDTGDAGEVVGRYLAQQAGEKASVRWDDSRAPGDKTARLRCVEVLDQSGEVANVVTTNLPFDVRMEFDLSELDEAFCVGFDLTSSDGTVVLRSLQTDTAREEWPELGLGRNSLACTIPAGLLNEGRYFVMPRLSLHARRWIVHGDGVISFQVHRDTESPYTLNRPGAVAPTFRWRTFGE